MTPSDYRKAFLPDGWHQRGNVPMTKEEVRWLSLLKLRIGPGDRILDIGAGTGSLSVGAALLAHEGQVIAVERNTEAVTLIRSNGEKAGLKNLQVIEGLAPEALDGLENALDAIFIGGSGGSMRALIEWSAARLKPGGRLVVNTVTIENAAEASAALKTGPFSEVEFVQVSVSRGRQAGGLTLWEAQNPVVIMSAVKEEQ